MKTTFFTFLLSLFSMSVYAQGESIKAITFNIRFDNVNDGNNQWSLRKENAAKFLRYEDPDFAGLQEALLHQIEYLDSAVEKMKWVGVGREDGKIKGEFSPLFYHSERFKLLDQGTFWLSETPEFPSRSWDAALPRVCTWGKFEKVSDGREVYVFNTHYDHIGEKARQKSSELILKKIREISGFHNTVLMGDFNALPESEVITTITGSMLSDAFNQPKIRFGQEGTFNGFDTITIPSRRIDFIFYSEDFIPGKYSTDSRIIDGRYLSDHFPVIVELDFMAR